MLKTQKDKKLENFFSSNNKTKKKKNIIVGLSGGVDSSLSAALLVERGWNVEGLTLWLMKGQGSCCSEGLVDAAGLCEDLGINHKIIDSREIFEREVIKKTTESYEKGFTPLPCSMCNKNVKFEEMLNYAINKKDFTHIATGHYARIKKSSYAETLDCKSFVFKDFLLLRGADENKDQSYFLYSLSQEVLSRLEFPLGEMKKEETSNGIQHFTVGQRKGLGIAWPEPLYVKSLDRVKNMVYVADKSDLFNKEAIISKVNWVSIEEPEQEIEVEAQIRYRSNPVKGTLIPLKNLDNTTTTFKLIFEESQSSVTPGQAAVFYKGEILLGGGLIN